MENEEVQQHNPDVRYDPSDAYVTGQDTEPATIVEEAPEPTPEPAPEAIPEPDPTPTPEPEPTEPQVKYVVPDELKQAMVNPETFQEIVRIQTMSNVDAMKLKIQREHPWATSQEDLENLLMKEFPDFDPEIPENNGLDATTLKRFNFIADGEKKTLLEDATTKLKEKIESFAPAPKEEAPFDAAAFEAKVLSHIDNSIAAYKAPEIPEIEGYQLNATVDMGKVREAALGAASGPFMANEKGELLPDVSAIADRMFLDQLREQLKPMAEALLRKAPEATKEAILNSLNNAPPPVAASGPDPNIYKNRNSGRYEGLAIASVSN